MILPFLLPSARALTITSGLVEVLELALAALRTVEAGLTGRGVSLCVSLCVSLWLERTECSEEVERELANPLDTDEARDRLLMGRNGIANVSADSRRAAPRLGPTGVLRRFWNNMRGSVMKRGK